MRIHGRSGLLLLAALACLVGTCKRRAAFVPRTDRSQGELPVMTAPRMASGGVQIDGRLDEPAWANAAQSGDFVDPGTGRPAPESAVNATARAGWDDQHLYLAVVVRDPAPATPFAATEVDPHLWEKSSAIELMLQPGEPGDNRDYYEVQVDTAGAVWDTRFDDYNQPITTGADGRRRFGHQDWSSGIRKGASVDRAAGQYTIELALPWAALRAARTPVPPRAGDVWRMNLYSFRDGQRDALAWSPTLGQGNFHLAARFGRLRFAGAPASGP